MRSRNLKKTPNFLYHVPRLNQGKKLRQVSKGGLGPTCSQEGKSTNWRLETECSRWLVQLNNFARSPESNLRPIGPIYLFSKYRRPTMTIVITL